MGGGDSKMTIIFQNFNVYSLKKNEKFAHLLAHKKLFFATHVKTKFKVLKLLSSKF